jgi:hypothetical protein
MAQRRAAVDSSPAEDATRPVIPETLAAELRELLGRWVAVFEDRIVASGDTAKEVTEAALRAGVTDPLVFRVPAHPERLNFL